MAMRISQQKSYVNKDLSDYRRVQGYSVSAVQRRYNTMSVNGSNGHTNKPVTLPSLKFMEKKLDED
jgi:hypothetical protein